jgi:hypothetical protein
VSRPTHTPTPTHIRRRNVDKLSRHRSRGSRVRSRRCTTQQRGGENNPKTATGQACVPGYFSYIGNKKIEIVLSWTAEKLNNETDVNIQTHDKYNKMLKTYMYRQW